MCAFAVSIKQIKIHSASVHSTLDSLTIPTEK